MTEFMGSLCTHTHTYNTMYCHVDKMRTVILFRRSAVWHVSPHDFRASSSYTLMSYSILTADVFSSAPVAFLKDPHTLCISAIILRGNKIPQNEPYIWITGNRSCFSFSLGGADSEDVQMQIICGLKKILFDWGSTEILLSSIT